MFATPQFKLMSDKQASDMFFTAGAPIQIKINGTVMPVNNQALDPEQVKKICYELMTESQKVLLNTKHIQELIKSDEIPQIKEAMEQSLSPGSQTFEQVLFKLYQAGRISMDEALACSDSPTNMHWLISNAGKSTGSSPQQPAAGTAPSAEPARPASSSGDLSSIKLDLDGLG
jgi:Tfp pilus assembly ATPase PilU